MPVVILGLELCIRLLQIQHLLLQGCRRRRLLRVHHRHSLHWLLQLRLLLLNVNHSCCWNGC